MSTSSSEDRVAPATWTNGHDTGCVLKDRYELREVRGQGGFATVYRARDVAFTILEVSVAVKLAHDRLSIKSRRRFEREANVAAQINHPNIVRVLDYGVLDGRPWFVMPLLHGHSLQQRRGGHWLEMSRLMLQLCSAVHAMHIGTALTAPGKRTPVLHRDIKPLNCFVTEREHCEPHLTLLDLGLCKLPGVQRLTSVGDTVGTMAYIAPECVAGAMSSSIRSEIYALGVTFFELLTGDLPDPTHRIRGLLDDTIRPPDPRKLRPEIPADLAASVMRAMAPQPAQRFADVAAMMTAISSVLGRVGVRRTPLMPRREGIAPVIPLHPAPHIEPASENTSLNADTGPEPAPLTVIPAGPRPAAALAAPGEPAAKQPGPTLVAHQQLAAADDPRVAPFADAAGSRRRTLLTAGALVVGVFALGILVQALRGAQPEDLTLLKVPAFIAPVRPRPAPTTQPASPLPATAASVSQPASQAPPAPRDAAARTSARLARAPSSPGEHAAALQTAIQAATETAAAALRACPDAPNDLSAQLQVHHRRGSVLMVDGEPVDASNAWHTCVRRELGRVAYPLTSTPVRARIRLSLR